MVIVACVLRSGGEYDSSHVRTLDNMVKRWLPGAAFRCLTDTPVKGIPCIRLKHAWPGWFAKCELFRPDVFPSGERLIYFDLDTVLVGDLTEIASYAGPFATLSDFYRPKMAASGVMAWGTDEVPPLYDPNRPPAFRGRLDRYIDDRTEPDRLQDLYPGQIYSWKADNCSKGIPKGARIICHHGQPRPWRVSDQYESLGVAV